MPDLHVVTGAFGYSGRRIAERLLAEGCRVRTLTHSPHRPDPFAGRVEVHPFHFDEPDRLADSLRGADVLYNTYWVRFNRGTSTFARAVENTRTLFDAARRAGVRRIVHVSITNPSEDSPFGYFRGKALLERALRESGLSHAILRPAVLFGGEGILVNNIAWALRTFPVVAIFGDGRYRLQPIHVDDFAALAVGRGRGTDNCVIEAVGPDTFTYRGLVEGIGRVIGCPRPVLGVPPWLGWLGAKMMGWWVDDVVLTWDEVKGLMAGLLCVDAPPAGTTRLLDWAAQNAGTLGTAYFSELARRT
jgi:uncharacterized protein YbjT (DUF2867 family)